MVANNALVNHRCRERGAPRHCSRPLIAHPLHQRASCSSTSLPAPGDSARAADQARDRRAHVTIVPPPPALAYYQLRPPAPAPISIWHEITRSPAHAAKVMSNELDSATTSNRDSSVQYFGEQLSARQAASAALPGSRRNRLSRICWRASSGDPRASARRCLLQAHQRWKVGEERRRTTSRGRLRSRERRLARSWSKLHVYGRAGISPGRRRSRA